MKLALPLLGIALAAAAVPAAAHAGARADYLQTFTTPVPGASSGADTQILYKNPSDPKAKPIPVRREVFTFPPGTGFDEAVVPPCKASNMEAETMGDAACPPGSHVLHGTGTTVTGFGGEEQPFDVNGWDDGSGLLLLGESKQFGIRTATRARRSGNVVTVEIPKTPGGPPDGESAFRKVHNILEERSLGDRAYTRTPPTCPRSGVWTFKAEFTFADGVVEKDVSEMPCEPDVTAPLIRIAGVPKRRCVSRAFRMRVNAGDATRVWVRLDGRVLRRATKASFTHRVRVRGLRRGRHRLAVTARDASGNYRVANARFRRC